VGGSGARTAHKGTHLTAGGRPAADPAGGGGRPASAPSGGGWRVQTGLPRALKRAEERCRGTGIAVGNLRKTHEIQPSFLDSEYGFRIFVGLMFCRKTLARAVCFFGFRGEENGPGGSLFLLA